MPSPSSPPEMNKEEMREKMRVLCQCLPFSLKASTGQSAETEKANFTDNISKAYTVTLNTGNNFSWQMNLLHPGHFHQEMPLLVGTTGSLSRNTNWSDARVWKAKGVLKPQGLRPATEQRLKDTMRSEATLPQDGISLSPATWPVTTDVVHTQNKQAHSGSYIWHVQHMTTWES